MNTVIIFALLIVLMLTGMPISISLGLTVLTFLFTLTQVPIESVALKLFTGIEKFEVMRSSSAAPSARTAPAWPVACRRKARPARATDAPAAVRGDRRAPGTRG